MIAVDQLAARLTGAAHASRINVPGRHTYQLRIKVEDTCGAAYLSIEIGGFSTREPVGWERPR